MLFGSHRAACGLDSLCGAVHKLATRGLGPLAYEFTFAKQAATIAAIGGTAIAHEAASVAAQPDLPRRGSMPWLRRFATAARVGREPGHAQPVEGEGDLARKRQSCGAGPNFIV